MKNIIPVLLLVLSTSASARDFTIPDWVLDSCAFVMRGDKAVGTGFLVGVAHTNAAWFYLVTAKHVVEPMRSSLEPLALRFGFKDKKETSTVVFPTIVFEGKRWFEHPNPAIDLAVLPIPPLQQDWGLRWNLKVVTDSSDEYFATTNWLQRFSAGPGDAVFTLGMVPYLLVPERNAVMARFGKISMLATEELSLPNGKQRAYFLDCATFPGNSGGPAFIQIDRAEDKNPLFTGWRFALLGVVTEFVPSPLREAEVTLQETEKQKVTIGLENTGISKVVPVDYLAEILFSEEQKRYRDATGPKSTPEEPKSSESATGTNEAPTTGSSVP